MVFSRIGNLLTRSRNVINRASGFAAPTVNASPNQFNRRFLGNLTAIGDGKKLDYRAFLLGSGFLAANFYSASPMSTDHMINQLKSRIRGCFEIETHIMAEPSKDREGYWILTQECYSRRYVITSDSMVSVMNAFLWSGYIIPVSFEFGALAFVLALIDSMMKRGLGVGLLPFTIPRVLFAFMLSLLLIPVRRWVGLPLFELQDKLESLNKEQPQGHDEL